MTVALFGDSLMLPRGADLTGDGTGIPAESTYPALLESELSRATNGQVRADGLRARTMPQLERELSDAMLAGTTHAAIHIGIVDCAPRVFSIRQHGLVKRLPKPVRKWVVGLAHRNRRRIIAARPMKVYTELASYRASAARIARRFRGAGIQTAFLSIAPPNEHFAFNSPGLTENVTRYNAALRDMCREEQATYLDLHSKILNVGISETLLKDGHHINFHGHRLVCDSLCEWLGLDTIESREIN